MLEYRARKWEEVSKIIVFERFRRIIGRSIEEENMGSDTIPNPMALWLGIAFSKYKAFSNGPQHRESRHNDK